MWYADKETLFPENERTFFSLKDTDDERWFPKELVLQGKFTGTDGFSTLFLFFDAKTPNWVLRMKYVFGYAGTPHPFVQIPEPNCEGSNLLDLLNYTSDKWVRHVQLEKWGCNFPLVTLNEADCKAVCSVLNRDYAEEDKRLLRELGELQKRVKDHVMTYKQVKINKE